MYLRCILGVIDKFGRVFQARHHFMPPCLYLGQYRFKSGQAVDTATQTEEVHLDLSSLVKELTFETAGSSSPRTLETPSSPNFRRCLEAETSMSSPSHARLCVSEATSTSGLISCSDVAACTGHTSVVDAATLTADLADEPKLPCKPKLPLLLT